MQIFNRNFCRFYFFGKFLEFFNFKTGSKFTISWNFIHNKFISRTFKRFHRFVGSSPSISNDIFRRSHFVSSSKTIYHDFTNRPSIIPNIFITKICLITQVSFISCHIILLLLVWDRDIGIGSKNRKAFCYLHFRT